MDKKKRSKSMLPEIKALISQRALLSDQNREELADALIEEISRLYPNEVPPAWETVIKKISHARRHEPSPLERPWYLSKTPDLPSEAIAAIFEVQVWLEGAKDNPMISTIPGWTENMTSGKLHTAVWPLTIREALWISRLCKVNYNLTDPEMLHLRSHKRPVIRRRVLSANPYRLWYAAKSYADYERLCEIAKIEFNTLKLDEAVRSGNVGETKYDLFSEHKSKKDGEK